MHELLMNTIKTLILECRVAGVFPELMKVLFRPLKKIMPFINILLDFLKIESNMLEVLTYYKIKSFICCAFRRLILGYSKCELVNL